MNVVDKSVNELCKSIRNNADRMQVEFKKLENELKLTPIGKNIGIYRLKHNQSIIVLWDSIKKRIMVNNESSEIYKPLLETKIEVRQDVYYEWKEFMNCVINDINEVLLTRINSGDLHE